jgi:hypothetical protein
MVKYKQSFVFYHFGFSLLEPILPISAIYSYGILATAVTKIP